MCISPQLRNLSKLTKTSFRETQPGQQLSQIEKSVTHLLVATKQLLETLTQWSRHNATEGEVSDVYVRLGYEFNIACRAFNGIGVDTSDLGPVPELLRTILEETLSQEASPASLDRFLPRIRDIIINLLHGLKRKQQRLRAKQAKDGPPSAGGLPPSASAGSLGAGLSQMLDDTAKKTTSRATEKRGGSGNISSGERTNGDRASGIDASSKYMASNNRDSINSGGLEAAGRGSVREGQRQFQSSFSDSSMSSAMSQSTSALLPSTEDGAFSGPPSAKSVSSGNKASFFQPPPVPPPKQQDALAALQRGGDLERRASRRYSAYQISKHLGASTNGIPMLPPAQHSPIPNRGRDVRDSMNAVRTRGSSIYSREKSTPRTGESSPIRNNMISNRISEESSHSGGSKREETESTGDDGQLHADVIKRTDSNPAPRMGATITSPIESLPSYPTTSVDDDVGLGKAKLESTTKNDKFLAEADQAVQQFIPDQSPQPGKELTLFLQYKTRIKKFVLSGGASELSIARLQLAFIEKFAWNTHSNGNDLPEIYVQDPVSGVRHELEDLRDVKDRSVLVLNVEALDEVKKHIDEGFGGIRRLVESVRSAVDSQQLSLQQVSDRQQDASRDLARLSLQPPMTPSTPVVALAGKRSQVDLAPDHATNIKSIRQELAVVRQTFTSMVSDVNSSMMNVKEKASTIKTMAIEGVMPDLDTTSGRAYVNAGKKSLGEESERIVNQVDDLQDLVEELRKDVVTRGVRPLPRQLDSVSKSVGQASTEVKKMQDFLRREKPIWTKIWEKELEVVCNDRDLLTMQEELATDLQDDLEKATQTFALVEQAMKQQNLQSSQGTGVSLRSTSKGLAAIASATDADVDPMKAKDGVLGEVRALRPNHEDRLEAIERAEKARQRELATRREGEFTKEVAAFVEEGRLKKSGGFEEAERHRRARDEKNMREAWQKQQDRAASKADDGPPINSVPNDTSNIVEAVKESPPSPTPDGPTEHHGQEAEPVKFVDGVDKGEHDRNGNSQSILVLFAGD